MLLGAGLGTRLHPLTDERPKPLVPVGDRTVLEHVAARLAEAGWSRLVVNAHSFADQMEEICASLPLPTEVVIEETRPRGTAGGVAGARAALGGGDVLVHNADMLVELDLGALVVAHTSFAALATLAVQGGLPPNEGNVGVDAEGRIVRLRDRSFGREQAGALFGGVQILSSEVSLPNEGCLVGDVYIPLLERGLALAAAPVVGRFFDIGSPAAYLEANLAWLAGRQSYLGHDAVISPRVSVVSSVVGRGARVDGAGPLERVVVWPGVRARAPLADAIVTRWRVVRASATRS
jgi:NDP-sugar pyrophosphorylase family protein